MSEDLSFRAKWKDEGVDAGLSGTARGMDGVTSRAKLMSESMSGLSGSTRSAGSSFGVLDAEIDKLTVSLGDQLIKLRAQKEMLSDPVYRKAAEHAAQLRRDVDKLNEGINSSTKASEKHGITWSEIVSKYYLASQAIGVLKNGMLALVDSASKYEAMQARLNAVEGSEAIGGRDFATAQKIAKQPGLGLEQVATTMATLRGMKITAAETESLIVGIGRANASAAGTADTFGRVMTQINQSMSTGKIIAQDLKPILAAIPTLAAALEDRFGAITSEALNEKLEKTGMSVREFWLEVANLGSNLPAASETIANNIDNMGDAYTRLKASMSDSESIKSATSAITVLLDRMSAALEKVKEIEKTRTRAGAAIGSETEAYTKQKAWSLLHPFSWASIDRSEQETSVGGAMGMEEQIARMAVTQQQQDDLFQQRKARQEEADRLASDKKKKDDAAADDAENASKRAIEAERNRMEAHRLASDANVETNFDGSVTLRSGLEWEAGDDPEHRRNRERADATDEKKYETSKREAEQAMREKIRLQKEYTKLVDDENKKRIDSEHAYWKTMEQAAASAIDNVLQTIIMGSGSMESKMSALFDQGVSSLLSSGVSMLMGAAFAPATGGASMAMPGALGLLGSFMGVRATGGAALGPVGVGERGPEVFRPATPGTVYNSSSSHYNYSGPITVVVSGANANEVAKDLPRAIENAQRNRRQTSISR